jgi:hypothetical protein
VNTENSDNCGHALPEKRKRNSKFQKIMHPTTTNPGLLLQGEAHLFPRTIYRYGSARYGLPTFSTDVPPRAALPRG